MQLGLAACRQHFGDSHVVVFSNTAGSSDDYNFQQAVALERTLGLRVVRHPKQKVCLLELRELSLSNSLCFGVCVCVIET
jgi:hypothetical protein